MKPIRIRVRSVTGVPMEDMTTGQCLRVEDMETGNLIPAQSITIRCDGRKGKVIAVIEVPVEELDVAAETDPQLRLRLKLTGPQSMQEGFTRGYWVDETGATVRQETDAEFRERVRRWG